MNDSLSSRRPRGEQERGQPTLGQLDGPDYYWRDYTGKIPYDAVPGGYDINKRTTYIGQAFYSKVGLLVGTIYPEVASLNFAYGNRNYETSDIGLKILCSSHLNCLSWKVTQSTDLHLTTIGEHLVIGGYEYGKIINVGRVMYQGELIVGKVDSSNVGSAKMQFVHRNEAAIVVDSYQLLVFNE